MARSLQEFLNAASTNTIRVNNQFEIMATSGYSDIDKVLETAVMFGQGISLPSRTIEYAAVSYKGFEFGNLVPTKMTMESEHTVTIIADVNGAYRRAFLAWMGKVMNPDITGGSVLEGDRRVNDKSIIRVQLFDYDNKTVTETYKFFNVRVTEVGAITLTYDGGDKATFDVKFKSSYWEIESSKKGALIGQK